MGGPLSFVRGRWSAMKGGWNKRGGATEINVSVKSSRPIVGVKCGIINLFSEGERSLERRGEIEGAGGGV